MSGSKLSFTKLREWNVLNEDPGRNVLWTRVNAAEAVPGVVSPLTATFWRASNLLCMRRHVHRMGVLRRSEVFYPRRPEESPSGYFLGRIAGNVEFARMLGDRLPGSSGDLVEKTIMGAVRTGVKSKKDRRRYPYIAFKLTWLLIGLPGEMRAHLRDTVSWWRLRVAELQTCNFARALKIFDEASNERQLLVMDRQMIVAQLSPVAWGPLHKLGAKLGSEDDALAITSGIGGVVENEMLDELWRVAHGELDTESFLKRYGYMSPDGGELESKSWREDTASLSATIRGYENTPASERPRARLRAASEQFSLAHEMLFKRANTFERLQLQFAIWFCRRYLPLREVGKAAMFALSDVGRAAARRMGSHLCPTEIDDPNDIFYLTASELRELAHAPRDVRAIVSERKALRAYYKNVDVPDTFTGDELENVWRSIEGDFKRGSIEVGAVGNPENTAKDSSLGVSICGVGVSKGVVSGRARVVLDPQQINDFERGDVLVCRTTDPGWAPLFSIASAMVVDVGGMLSHSAIIARELGLPAVVNTKHGTKLIPDMCTITVNGSTGVVTVVASTP